MKTKDVYSKDMDSFSKLQKLINGADFFHIKCKEPVDQITMARVNGLVCKLIEDMEDMIDRGMAD